MTVWPDYKVKVLNMARAANNSVLREATDDDDDGEYCVAWRGCYCFQQCLFVTLFVCLSIR